MRHARARRSKSVLCFVATALATALAGATPRAQDARDALRFAERYALADDRANVVETLLPGSEERYEYECRLAEAAGNLDEVDRLLVEWDRRHGHTRRHGHPGTHRSNRTDRHRPDGSHRPHGAHGCDRRARGQRRASLQLQHDHDRQRPRTGHLPL